jgi:DNA polymerase-4
MILSPELKGKYIGVCGSVENRHGIILAKSENAKKLGVKTGMTINDALKLCPDLTLVEAKHENYIKYSKLVREIYREYTDQIESFGIDECWLDVTSSLKMFGDGKKIADEIREKVKTRYGLTVSVGVSFNKVFSKLGSDLKKPDGTTVISIENFKEKIYGLPVADLLFVGRSTAEKLVKINVNTIGDLARIDKNFLVKKFGKWGETLHDYATGKENSPVLKDGESDEIKSVGNSITCYRDLTSYDDVKIVFNVLAESVSSRVIANGLGRAETISISVRDNYLKTLTRQCKFDVPTNLATDFEKIAFNLFKKNFTQPFSIRTLGLSVCDFSRDFQQITVYEKEYGKKERLNTAIIDIKSKYGNESLLKGIVLKDKKFMRENPEETHIVHPDGHI